MRTNRCACARTTRLVWCSLISWRRASFKSKFMACLAIGVVA